MNINEVLQTGREALLKSGIDPRETRLLLAFAMGIKSQEIIKYKECSEYQYKLFIDMINRRIAGEPYAYIVGHKEFMKLDFKIDSNVLIPREDTEILVQEILNLVLEIDKSNIKYRKSIKILDMCTGSGCIAISLAKYIKDAKVVAVDISEKALNIAKENAIINEVEIEFVNSNLFEKLTLMNKEENSKENAEKLFDIIVSNPPYIRKGELEELQIEVKNEPIIALDGGNSGLDFYEKITKEGYNYLKENGILAFEIGFDQGDDVAEIMKVNNFKDIKIIKDMSENNRVVIGKKYNLK